MIRYAVLWLVIPGLLFCGCGKASRNSEPQITEVATPEIDAVGSDSSRSSADQSSISVNPSPADQAEEPDEITVVMEDYKGGRRGKNKGDSGVMNMLFGGLSNKPLAKQGAVKVGGHEYVLYLPKSASYTCKNTGADDSDFENNSTLISIDQNGDGNLTEEERWFANLPLRLGDTMYDIVDIADDGRRIVLKKSDSALRGVIVGRKCPPFSFKTSEGQEINLQAMTNKAFILDIWSIT